MKDLKPGVSAFLHDAKPPFQLGMDILNPDDQHQGGHENKFSDSFQKPGFSDRTGSRIAHLIA